MYICMYVYIYICIYIYVHMSMVTTNTDGFPADLRTKLIWIFQGRDIGRTLKYGKHTHLLTVSPMPRPQKPLKNNWRPNRYVSWFTTGPSDGGDYGEFYYGEFLHSWLLGETNSELGGST